MSDLLVVPPKITQLSCWNNKLGLPRFLVEQYEGMEDDIATFFQSLHYHLLSASDDLTNTLTSISAKSKLAALMHTGALAASMEDAVLIQLQQANREGWYHRLGKEYDISSVRQLIELSLQKQIERDPTGGMRYEYQKLLTVLQVIENMAIKSAADNGDISPETQEKIVVSISRMASSPNARSKMRECGRTVQAILDSEYSEDEKLAKAADVFHDVADPDVTVQEFRATNRERVRDVGHNVPNPVEGGVVLLAGTDYIVIESPGQQVTRMIESAVRGIVSQFSVIDPASFLKKLTDELYTANQYEYYGFLPTEEMVPVGHEKIPHTVVFPKPHKFQELVTVAVSSVISYLYRLLLYEDTSVLVYEVNKYKTLDAILQELTVDESVLLTGLRQHYVIPPLVVTLLSEYDYDLVMIQNELHLAIRRKQ